jgi:hypothetical protein
MDDPGDKWNLVALSLSYRELLIFLFLHRTQRRNPDHPAVAFAYRAQPVRTQHRFHHLIPRIW